MAASGELPKTTGDILYAADVNMFTYSLGAGSVTVQTDTTDFATDYADISIAANKLGTTDTIMINLIGNNPGNQNFNISIEAQAVTSVGAIVGLSPSVGAGQRFFADAVIMQDVTNNDTLSGRFITQQAADNLLTHVNLHDTNDANVMATAWTLRLAFSHGATASAASLVQYSVWIVKGA